MAGGMAPLCPAVISALKVRSSDVMFLVMKSSYVLLCSVSLQAHPTRQLSTTPTRSRNSCHQELLVLGKRCPSSGYDCLGQCASSFERCRWAWGHRHLLPGMVMRSVSVFWRRWPPFMTCIPIRFHKLVNFMILSLPQLLGISEFEPLPDVPGFKRWV